MPSKPCVVLVPVRGSILPQCESGLRKLELRGYEVRRVGGFSAIDLARCQMAADALADGFDETMWIDSDVAFDPADVERLRAHQLDFVSGIYPTPGHRELACHTLPGTHTVTFGEAGGLIEVHYASGGFTLVRRAVYEQMRDRLRLPVCRARFGRPFWPWFHPLVRPDGAGHWYLTEDWSFCQRAREMGLRIFADTSIRLRRFGDYGYTWEESGLQRARFSSFVLQLPSESGKLAHPIEPLPILRDEATTSLARTYPWPPTRPEVSTRMHDGWLRPSARRELLLAIEPGTRIVLELGSWLGLSTRFIADHAPSATVIAFIHWRGSPEHVSPEEQVLLPVLHETFLANTWDYRTASFLFAPQLWKGCRKCLGEESIQI